MKSIQQIKKEEQDKLSELFKTCAVFFAFSNQQFKENKTPLEEGEKYVSIGAGGYLPKGKVAAFQQGMKDLKQWYKDEVKNNKARRALIADELANHEAYYTQCIEDTLRALGPDFTKEEVQAVFQQERKNWQEV